MGQESLPEVRMGSRGPAEVREGSGGPRKGPGEFRDDHPQFQEGSGGPPAGQGVVERTFRRSGGVGRTSHRSRRGREDLLQVRVWSG